MEISIRNEHFFTLCFEDDRVVTEKDEKNLSYMIRTINKFEKKEYLKINKKLMQNKK